MSEKKEMPGLIIGLVALLCVVAFFVIGFTTGMWHLVWLVFLAVPVTAVIVSFATEKKDIAGAIVGLVALLCVVAYAVMGFMFGLWHPGWMIFLAIPIVGIIADIIKGKADSVVGLVALLCVVTFLVLGFTFGLWHIVWLVFLLIPITAIIKNMVRIVTKKDVPDDISKD